MATCFRARCVILLSAVAVAAADGESGGVPAVLRSGEADAPLIGEALAFGGLRREGHAQAARAASVNGTAFQTSQIAGVSVGPAAWAPLSLFSAFGSGADDHECALRTQTKYNCTEAACEDLVPG